MTPKCLEYEMWKIKDFLPNKKNLLNMTG